MPIWDPFRELASMEREMRRLFDDFWGRRTGREALPGPRRAGLPAEREEGLIGTPAVDLIDKKDTLIFRAEMPGVKKEDIKISVDENSISVSGKGERKKEEKREDYYYAERAYGSWERTLALPTKVKTEEVKAKYENGVLEVSLPKVEEAKPKAKEIKIE
jgi:HSP20 family protein